VTRAARRRRLWRTGGLLAAAPLLVAACSIGSGSGSAKGSLWAVGCDDGSIYGTVVDAAVGATSVTPNTFDLSPTFFAGTPFDDPSNGPTYQNRLFLRMQRTNLQIQYEDVLWFEVQNSYEVARCVRGRTVNGQADWKATEPTITDSRGYTEWCDWTGTAFSDGGPPTDAAAGGPADAASATDGGMSVMAQAPRIHIVPDTDVESTLQLGSTCPRSSLSGIGVSGWIQFLAFGSASQSDRAPEDRDQVSPKFIINYGDRLRANFSVDLEDARIFDEEMMNIPPPSALMGASLEGYFDFELERGRSAQPFP
jgi:hypothetical protein